MPYGEMGGKTEKEAGEPGDLVSKWKPTPEVVSAFTPLSYSTTCTHARAHVSFVTKHM